MDREPCPWRIVDDAGGAFTFGLVGGTIWHAVGGFRNAPKSQRIAQAISRVRARVPMLGGSFAVWGTLFSCCDCTMVAIRKKEDPWNAIISGAATGGILAARAGAKAAGKSALAGGVILAAIEGLSVVLTRVILPKMEQQQQDQMGGIKLDRLEPPVDLRRRKYMRESVGGAGSLGVENVDMEEKKSYFDVDKMLSSANSNDPGKSDSDSGAWDLTRGTTSGIDSSSNENAVEEKPSKPFWQIW